MTRLLKADQPAAWAEDASRLLQEKAGVTVDPSAWQAAPKHTMTAWTGQGKITYVRKEDRAADFLYIRAWVVCCTEVWRRMGAADFGGGHSPDCRYA